MNIYIIIGTRRELPSPSEMEPLIAEVYHAGHDMYEALKILAYVKAAAQPDNIWLEIWRDGKRTERMCQG